MQSASGICRNAQLRYRGGGRTSISVRPCSRTQSGINRIRSVHTEVANQHRSDIFDLV